MSNAGANGRIHFGAFEVDPKSAELWKGETRIRLQEQPFTILTALLERPGEVVTREELRRRIWGEGTFVDFDHGLNAAVNRLREALCDSAENPRYVETVAKRGYRFVHPVAGVSKGGHPPIGKRWWIGVVGMALLAAGGWWAVDRQEARPLEVRWRQVTADTVPKMWPVLSDGTRLYYTSENTLAPTPERRHTLMQVPIGGGQSTPVPISLGDLRASLFDISGDGQELLLGVASKGGLAPRDLWAVRVADGLRRRIGSLTAKSARLSPDGRWLAYLLDSGVYLASADGTGSRRLAEYQVGFSDRVSWSTDGKRLFLVRSDLKTRRVTAWELRVDSSVLRRVAPEWKVDHGVVGESPNGRHLLLLSSGSLFSVPTNGVGRKGSTEPVRLTQGTPLFFPPVRSSDGRYFTLGRVLLGELQRYDPIAKTWRRHLDGISADNVTYSRDGQWVAYIRYPGAILWRCRADGSNCEQLTKPPRRAVIAHWSPDSRTLGASVKDPEKPYRIWLYENSGREPREAAPGHVGTQGDFDWFPSGKKLVIALMGSYNTGEGHYLRVVDLESGKVEKFPGSEGLHSPRWSPDGTMLAGLVALDPRGERLRIFHVSKGAWVPTSNDIVRYPVWAPDSRSILFFSGEALRRFHVDTGKPETVVEILGEELTGNWFPWSGADGSGAPLILRNRNVTQVYELEFLPR